MPETNRDEGQRYTCTASECPKVFQSIDEWRLHVNRYRFEKGHICLYKNCQKFIPIRPNISLSHRSHLYLSHDVEPQWTEKKKRDSIDRNFCFGEEGKIWCSACQRCLELGNRANVLDHFERHILHGCTLKIPGQTNYPETSSQFSDVLSGQSASSTNDGNDEGKIGAIDLSSRGTTYPTPIATNDHASIQLNFYRILTYTVGLDFACPLCLTGYSRYDALYAHFRNTEEKQHEALKDLWFSGVCTVCKEPSDTTTFYHIKCRHPGSYQTLMKNTLRLRPEVNETIPAAPHCFEHKFFFPLRQPASIVRLPRKKRKTRKPAGKGYPSDNQESSMDGASHLLTTSGLAHQESQLLSAYEPCGYGVADGTC
ncbi:hypothetical protein BDV59DRAFT_211425 [Aspergillus ambiguus]|uniref:uncharacterized protein n=1 Tax=Aspergillus ambiguus TaxID=176160 RepID=UPI003CCCAF3E